MDFDFEAKKEERVEYKPHLKFRGVSVMAAFKANGEIIPRMVQMEMDNGELRVYHILMVTYSKLENFCGIPKMIFGIKLDSFQNCLTELVYHIEEHKWEIKYET